MADDPYRVLSPAQPDPYQLAWRRIRRAKRNVFLFTLLAIFVLVFGRGHLFVFGGTIVATIVYASFFRCPSCHQAALFRGLHLQSFASKCGHCGMQFGTPRPSFVQVSEAGQGPRAVPHDVPRLRSGPDDGEDEAKREEGGRRLA